MIRSIACYLGSYDDLTSDINAMIHLIVRQSEQHAEPYSDLVPSHLR